MTDVRSKNPDDLESSGLTGCPVHMGEVLELKPPAAKPEPKSAIKRLQNLARTDAPTPENPALVDITQLSFDRIKKAYLTGCVPNRPNKPLSQQNRYFYAMSPVGHRFLENMDSSDPMFGNIFRLAKRFSSVLEINAREGLEYRLAKYWCRNSPIGLVTSIRDNAFGAVLQEVWQAFFATKCSDPQMIQRAVRNVLMAVKNYETVDRKTREDALRLVQDAVAAGLNPQLQIDDVPDEMHKAVYALIVSSVSEISEGFAHTEICLAQDATEQPATPDDYVMATYEALRLYPLFSVSTRPSTCGQELRRLDYCAYHRRTDLFGDDANSFNWRRWQEKSLLKKSLVFGVGNNRSCPGRNSAMRMIPIMVRCWREHFDTTIWSEHTRALPYGGLAAVRASGCQTAHYLNGVHLAQLAVKNIVFHGAGKYWVRNRNAMRAAVRSEADAYYAGLNSAFSDTATTLTGS